MSLIFITESAGNITKPVIYLGNRGLVTDSVEGRNWLKIYRNGMGVGYVFAPLLGETVAQDRIKKPDPVRTDIGRTASKSLSAVAIILGNHDYMEPVPDVDFASRDADAFKRFLIGSLGYHEENIIDLRDATQAEVTAVFGNRKTHEGRLWRRVTPGESDLVVYYSGHGVPGLSDRRGYLLPVNADPDAPELNGFPLDLLFANLAKLNTKSVTVYIDACFSGESPKGMLVSATSGMSIEARMPVRAGNMTIITAATGDQVASWDLNAKHGLFTLHLLKALTGVADGGNYGNGDGKVTLSEVKRYLDEEMTYAARRQFGREQNASVRGDSDTVLAVLQK